MEKITGRFYCESCDLIQYADQIPSPEKLKSELMKFMRNNSVLNIVYYNDEQQKYALNLITHNMQRFPYFEYILKNEDLNPLSTSTIQFHDLLSELGSQFLIELGIPPTILSQKPQFSYRSTSLKVIHVHSGILGCYSVRFLLVDKGNQYRILSKI